MRLTIDLDEQDLEELLYINVNFRVLRRLLPIIKVVAPELSKSFKIKWKDVMAEFGKDKLPVMEFSRDGEIRYPETGRNIELLKPEAFR